MSAIRLPPWEEILAPEAPWALLLRSGPAGVWLLRELAEEVSALDVYVVEGGRCATSAGLVDEWSLALELEEPGAWDDVAATLAARSSAAPCGVLVSRAERLLLDEPARLPELLGALRGATDAGDRPLRFVFQARDLDPEREAVLRQFEVREVAASADGT